MIEKEVGDLEQEVKSGLENGSLPFKTATKMIVEMGDVSPSPPFSLSPTLSLI